MTYIQGFIVPVPESKKAAYRKMAEDSVPLFTDYGAQRIVENWGDQIPTGETTDMYRAVKAEEGENIVFSWAEWASKEACDKAHQDMTSDERMQEPPPEMPFDGMRMTYAGFDKQGESGEGGATGYVQGYVAPVSKDKRAAFSDMCATMREIAIDCGALHAADSLADDIANGQVTDFKQAVKAQDGEAIAFGYIEWPSKHVYEQGSAKMREDNRMQSLGPDMPIDGKRMIVGGFENLLDTNSTE